MQRLKFGNKNSGDLKLLAVDQGFCAIKYFYDGKTGRIPTAFRLMEDGYLYGEQALSKPYCSHIKTFHEYFRHYDEFIKLCISDADVPKSQKLHLLIGLPNKFIKAINKGTGSIASIQNLLKSINIDNISVLPLELCGINAYLSENPENTENLLFVDIGFNTVTFSVVKGDLHIIEFSNTYFDRGIKYMTENIALPTMPFPPPKREISPLEYNSMIECGYVLEGFARVDIGCELQQAAEVYVRALFNDIWEEITEQTRISRNSLRLVIYGGGALVVSKAVSLTTSCIMLESPAFANVRGLISLYHSDIVQKNPLIKLTEIY